MKRTPAQLVKNYLWIIVGSAIYALAFDWFYAPNAIAFGGVTGLAQIVNYFFPAAPVGVQVIVYNVPLFLLGWRFLGGHMLVSSLVSMGISSVFLDLLAAWYPFQPMADPLLAAICGGALMGVGIGVIFLQGATTGGTEIVAKLLKLKLAWLSTGKLLMVIDLAVILSVALAFRDVNAALYGVVANYLATAVMDGVLYGLDNAKVAYIISDKPEEIARAIMGELDRSVTFLDGEGGYTGAKKRVVLCAFKQKQIVAIKNMVCQVDPAAFMIVTAAHEVLGEGFGSYHQEM